MDQGTVMSTSIMSLYLFLDKVKVISISDLSGEGWDLVSGWYFLVKQTLSIIFTVYGVTSPSCLCFK